MTAILDERQHIAALSTLMTATLGPDRVYDFGMVPGADGNPGDLPPIFALLALERRYVQPNRAGRSGVTGWRLSVRYVGRSVAEARWAQMQVAAALNEVTLTIAGVTSTPVTHESTTAIALDDGRFSGLSSWTYAL